MNTLWFAITQQDGAGAHTVTQRVYPCQCGQTHRGVYAFEDWMRHNCNHGAVTVIADDVAICDACGAGVNVTDARLGVR